ncbi:DUF1700 domain-containing protein [Undibacterium crateris]|uniref:DUF1700 domain-containing protein n=1 Tax=Undibacterium crateris TaxID=2528175 RepID=UPI00138A315F|nr:DUF1700 domain-containing protein [Undibacterium crateris]NDI84935.1 DUF1700 domain-containing protein [Undibacterium crateris]
MMNKASYMHALQQALTGLPGPVIEECLWTYERKFLDAMLAGESEESIAARLPKPELVAAQKKTSVRYQALQVRFNLSNLARLFVALTGLAFLNLLLIAPVMATVSVLFAGFVASVCLYFGGILLAAAGVAGISEFHVGIPQTKNVTVHQSFDARIAHEPVQIEINGSGVHTQTSTGAEKPVALPATAASDASVATQTEAISSAQTVKGEPLDIQFSFSQPMGMRQTVKGMGMIIGSILLMMLTLWLTRFSWRGALRYLRWSAQQLRQPQMHAA